MATKTTNYGLTKPAYDEDADIKVINDNMDIIDAKMKEIENAGGGGGGGSFEILQKEISGNTGETGVLLTGLLDSEYIVLGISCVSASYRIYNSASHSIAVQLYDINNNIKMNADMTITIYYIKISN